MVENLRLCVPMIGNEDALKAVMSSATMTAMLMSPMTTGNA